MALAATPPEIRYYVDTVQEEVKEEGQHVGWRTVDYVCRQAIRYENGKPLIQSDVRIGDDPEAWKQNNPNLKLHGDTQQTREEQRAAARRFLAEASAEELAELGLSAPAEEVELTEEEAELVFPEDEDEDEDDLEYPVDIGGGVYVTSDGEKWDSFTDAIEHEQNTDEE